jgi:hypothetical protein
MSVIDTRLARLAVLRQQVERLPPWERDVTAAAFDVADVFAEETDRIASARYTLV